MRGLDTRNTIKLFILEMTDLECLELKDECMDLIQDDCITFESYRGVYPDTVSAVIELKDDVEKYSISHNDAGCTLEIVTANYIMMHDINTASEVRCLI